MRHERKVIPVTFDDGEFQVPVLFSQDNMTMDLSVGDVIGEGTMYYNKLYNKPSINGVTLVGDKSTGDLLITYDALDGRPSINEVTLTGDKSSADLGLGSAEDVAELEEKKANKDGSYSDMTVGNAEQLVATVGVEDKVPYNFRTSGGSADIGNRLTEKLIGGTVAWNQLVKNGNFATDNGWTGRLSTVSISNGIATVTPTSDGTLRGLTGGSSSIISFVSGHKYYIAVDVLVPIASSISLSIGGGGDSINSPSSVANTWTRVCSLWTHTNTSTGTPYALVVGTLTTSQTAQFKNFICCDLTQMFGSTIADYIYGLETATAGAGVAWFRKLFTKDYYAYDTGSLQSVKALSHEMVGFNQWDEEWESGVYATSDGSKASNSNYIRSKNLIPLLPNTTYYLSVPSNDPETVILWYDVNKTYTTKRNSFGYSSSFTTGSDVYYCHFYTKESAYNNDICINLSWSGYRNGEYEPYVKYSYPLDDDLELRGIPKLDANNALYYDGDTYESDGTVTRKYAIVDMSTLEWVTAGATGQLKGANVPVPPNGYQRAITTNYVNNLGDTANLMVAGEFMVTPTTCYVYPRNGETPTGYLLYELATPTTETADEFVLSQAIDDFGTETYVDAGVAAGTRDVAIPVGHDTFYMENLRDKLQHLPSLADDDGTYLVVQNGSQMELLAYPDEFLSDLEDEVDALAAKKADADGTHEDLTAGNAEQLLADTGVEDKVPYNFRPSGGEATVGDRLEEKMLVGGTVAWNQLCKINPNVTTDQSTSYNGITITFKANGSMLINGTAEANFWMSAMPDYYSKAFAVNLSSVNGHKLLFGLFGSTSFGNRQFGTSNGAVAIPSGHNAIVGTLYQNADLPRIQLQFYSGDSYSNALVWPQFFDLTQMFGSAIADYIYAIETATAGAGVAWFRKLFPKDYYAYDVGSLQSVQAKSHETVGFNQWDEVWENGYISTSDGTNIASERYIRSKNYIPVIKGQTYYVKAPAPLKFIAYDENKSFMFAVSYTWQNESLGVYLGNASYIRFYSAGQDQITTYNHNICINLSDPTKNGEYEPYVKHSYPLDSDLTLRGIPKLDAGNKLYYDGDTYASDGTVTRKYGIVDLGTLTWTRYNFSGTDVFYASVSDRKSQSSNIECAKYSSVIASPSDLADKTINSTSNGNYIYIRDDSYSDASTFKTAMSGVYLVYELATPTTESADPYRELQQLDPYGTEAYVDAAVTATTPTRDVAIPVGHVGFYPENLRKKIEGLPWDLSAIAPIENGSTASKAYTQGKYFLRNNQFCKAKTAIAANATFTLGTNYEVTTVADELYAALNS